MPVGKCFSRRPETPLPVVKPPRHQSRLVSQINLTQLAIARPRPAFGAGLDKMLRPRFTALQLGNERRHQIEKARRPGDLLEVAQALAAHLFGDNAPQQDPLHRRGEPRDGLGRQFQDLVGEIIERRQIRTKHGGQRRIEQTIPKLGLGAIRGRQPEGRPGPHIVESAANRMPIRRKQLGRFSAGGDACQNFNAWGHGAYCTRSAR